jgi:replicative DNA helicase
MTRGLTVVGGPPSAGKSVLACQVAALMAARGQRVVYASYEMSWEVVQLRCASSWSCHHSSGVTSFSWSDVVTGRARAGRPAYDGLTRDQLSRYLVGDAMDPVTRALTAWDEGPGRNLAVLTGGEDVHALVEEVRSVEGERPVLVVDYIQIVPSGEDADEKEYSRVTAVVNALQKYAYSEGGGNVLAVSSTRNLTPQDYKDGPSMSWYRGSGYVGYAAEQAVMMVPDRRMGKDGRMELARDERDMSVTGLMTVVKNKSGASDVSIATRLYGGYNLLT